MSYDEHLISMAGGDGDKLVAIEERSDYAMAHESLAASDYAEMAWDSARDIPALLAMVREQRARLDAATATLDEWATHKAFPDAEESQRWYSLGKRHAADAIRAAITATEGA